MSDVRLAALWMRPALWNRRSPGWLAIVSKTVKRLGYSTLRNRSAIYVWRPDRQRKLPTEGHAVDGWQLRKLWLGTQQPALGVRPIRIYLRHDGSRDKRPEREIVVRCRRPQWPLEERRLALTSFLEHLQESCGQTFEDSVGLVAGEVDPLNGIRVLGSTQTFSANIKHRVVHEKGGFRTVSDCLEVLVCCDHGVDSRHSKDYSHRAKEALARGGANAKFRDITLDELEARLNELDQGGTVKRYDVPVLFMLERKDKCPSRRLRRAMRVLERHHLPWRRAYAIDDRRWSVYDQAGSLLQAAGGHPHAVALTEGESLPWSIGIDLSHRATYSRIAASLVSPDGQLVKSWILDQERQENVKSAALRRLLVTAAREVPMGERSAGLLVVRDGRVFESEFVDDYRRELGGPVTLVELRKNGNPPMLLGGDARLPTNPVVGWLREAVDGSLGFLTTLPKSVMTGEFGSVLKVWMSQTWDGMNLGPEQLVRILFAQTLTPGLGLGKRRLPAPIYWADGIAGASDNDLRFRGQCVVDLN